MAKDILFKPQVEATEQIMHKTGHLAVQESTTAQIKNCTKLNVCSSYLLFSFYFTPEKLTWESRTEAKQHDPSSQVITASSLLQSVKLCVT